MCVCEREREKERVQESDIEDVRVRERECVCVCERERERERETETDRDREREKEREKKEDLGRVEESEAAPALEVRAGPEMPDQRLGQGDVRVAHVRCGVQCGAAAGRHAAARGVRV